MSRLYFFWSHPEAGRIRLALGYKGMSCAQVPVAYDDDVTFFDLGIARHGLVYQADSGQLHTDSLALLAQADQEWSGPPLWTGQIDAATWAALTDWRQRAEPMLARLYAPVRPAYQDIGLQEDVLAAYKREVQDRFGLSLEELANDRYDAYAQLDKLTGFRRLGSYLAERRFYSGTLSVADLLLAADLFPLQILDGITVPVDLMYYFERVEQACHVSLREGLLIS